jgi:hypothetical protein
LRRRKAASRTPATHRGRLKKRPQTRPSDFTFRGVAVYDGTDLAGFIVERTGGRFVAYGVDHQVIGTFASQRDAMRAIPAVVRL